MENNDSLKITVLCTVYNGEKYFDRAIPSILNQTYQNFDFIIINDGSDDNTLEKLQEIAKTEPRIKIYSPGRLGRSQALNYGLKLVETELVAFQDFDDVSYPIRLEKQVAFMLENPKVAWSCGYSIAKNDFRKKETLRELPLDHNSIVNEMVYQIPWDMTLVMARTKGIFESIKDGYPKSKEGVEDLKLVLKIVKSGWLLGNIPEIIGEHYEHPSSYFNSNNTYIARQKSLMKVQKQVIKELKLPIWNYSYLFIRYFYPYLPSFIKQFLIILNNKKRSIFRQNNDKSIGKISQKQKNLIEPNVKITVLCTVYNGEKYINRAIPSILSQTYKNFDFLIIDDGSTDNTVELVNNFAKKDSRIKLFSPGRLGRTGALKHGINLSTSDLIAFQDFDDLSYPERLEKQVQFMYENPKIGWSCSNSFAINETRKSKFLRELPLNHNSIIKEMVYQIPWDMTLVIARKEALLEALNQPFSEKKEGLVDLKIVLKIIKAGWELGNIPNVLGEHFEHKNSFYNKNNTYFERQKYLRNVQKSVIDDLGLSKWNYIYLIFRYFYAFLPHTLKIGVIKLNNKLRNL